MQQSLKSQIRDQMRSRRRAISPAKQLLAAKKLRFRLLRVPEFIHAKHIALYLPSDGEISPLLLLNTITRKNKHCYLPRIEGRHMFFARFRRGDKLETNKFGIPEPLKSAPKHPAQDLDFVCLPLVAFDRQGRRLGRGGGYYDRCFAYSNKRWRRKPFLVGVAHDAQKTALVPHDHWDISLDCIVSDRETIRPKPSV